MILALRNTALLFSIGQLLGQMAARSSPQSIFLQPMQYYISLQRVKLWCFITFQCSKGKLLVRYLTLNESSLVYWHCLALQINFNTCTLRNWDLILWGTGGNRRLCLGREQNKGWCYQDTASKRWNVLSLLWKTPTVFTCMTTEILFSFPSWMFCGKEKHLGKPGIRTDTGYAKSQRNVMWLALN